MSGSNYLFYDLETSGLNKAFDQIIQFAAIRTDLQFNEIARYEIIIKPNSDTIPNPYATITHRTPLDLWRSGEPELVAIEKIHRLFNTPGTISLGYNTLGFDDEFLRFSFYKNLLPAYTHQFANQCSRADLYPIAALYYLFSPDCLVWPKIKATEKNTLKTSLKLEYLSAQNQLATGAAHTAIVDVEATVALAKIFAQNQAMWDYALGYFMKTQDSQRIHKLSAIADQPNLLDYHYGILVDGIFGSDHQFHAPVLYLGAHKHYKNQVVFLRLDTEKLSTMTSNNFQETSWVIQKKLGEPGFVLPAKKNYLSRLSSQQEKLLAANLAFLNQNQTLLTELQAHYLDYKYPPAPQTDVDASLYLNGFLSQQEQIQCHHFHTAPIAKKSSSIEQLAKPYLRELAIRALGRFDSKLLSPEQAEVFSSYLAKLVSPNQEPILDYKNQAKLTVNQALAEIAEINERAAQQKLNLDEEQKKLLTELTDYLEKNF